MTAPRWYTTIRFERITAGVAIVVEARDQSTWWYDYEQSTWSRAPVYSGRLAWELFLPGLEQTDRNRRIEDIVKYARPPA